MIDLRSELPAGFESGGEFWYVDTSFRTWIDWMHVLEEDGIAKYSIFDGPVPAGMGWVEDALRFANSPNETPRQDSHSRGPQLYDMLADGDYIVGAFQQAYGIDLTDPSLEMHWHRFLALFRSLPDDTMMAQIMSWRGWSEADAKKKPERQYRELRRRWALPMKHTAENDAVIEWAEKAFGKLGNPKAGDAPVK